MVQADHIGEVVGVGQEGVRDQVTDELHSPRVIFGSFDVHDRVAHLVQRADILPPVAGEDLPGPVDQVLLVQGIWTAAGDHRSKIDDRNSMSRNSYLVMYFLPM